ncbi:hypothetical protein CFRS1_v004486 [Colletotrichum fructicola]|nr:hypothetical protein CFRS1_v004486 [Colletotrichum fructicola]
MSQYTDNEVTKTLQAIATGQSLRKAAQEHGVPKSTLARRMQGAQSRDTAYSDRQRLSTAQESHLAEWVRIQAALGLPPTHQQLKEFAELILQNQGDSQPLGKNWIQSFIKRNPSAMFQAPRHT